MSKTDFKFIGTTTSTTDTNGIEYKMYQVGKTNGLDSTVNGGYAMVGSAGQHAGLASALTNSGTYYRAYNFMDDAAGNATEQSWAGIAVCSTSSFNGDTFSGLLNHNSGTAWNAPSTTTGKRNRIALSLRAHLRLETSTGNSTGNDVGSCIGIVAGVQAPHRTTGHYFNQANAGATYARTMRVGDQSGHRIAGYSLMLSSLKHTSNLDGDQDVASNFGHEAVRLLFSATPAAICNYAMCYEIDPTVYPNHGVKMRACAGTYAFNTWYKVRMDIISMFGCDKVLCYTAAASDTLGSETWTLRNTEYIFATERQFWNKGMSNAALPDYETDGTRAAIPSMNSMGYFVAARTAAAAVDQGRHSAFIDNFQVLAESLETTQ